MSKVIFCGACQVDGMVREWPDPLPPWIDLPTENFSPVGPTESPDLYVRYGYLRFYRGDTRADNVCRYHLVAKLLTN